MQAYLFFVCCHNCFKNIPCFHWLVPTGEQLAFLTLCDQAFNPPFLGDKIIELVKICFKNKRFEPCLSFFSKPVIVSTGE